MVDEAGLLELIAGNHEGVLAGVTRGGYPHLTNIWYVWDPEHRVARISTTAHRVKGRIFRRNPHAALYVAGPDFWKYAVAQGEVDTTEVSAQPGDTATRELLEVHQRFSSDPLEEDAFYRRMIEEQRLVLRLHVARVYGLARD